MNNTIILTRSLKRLYSHLSACLSKTLCFALSSESWAWLICPVDMCRNMFTSIHNKQALTVKSQTAIHQWNKVADMNVYLFKRMLCIAAGVCQSSFVWPMSSRSGPINFCHSDRTYSISHALDSLKLSLKQKQKIHRSNPDRYAVIFKILIASLCN